MGYLIANLLNLIYKGLTIAILARVIISWIPNINIYNEPFKTLIKITDKILDPIRDLLDRVGFPLMIDISPIIAVFLIRFIYRLLIILLVF